MLSVGRLVGIFGLLFAVSVGFQWAPAPKDGSVIYACVGNDVTFPWTYTLSPNEEITSMEWLFDGFSQEMIAIFSHGLFLPTPAFSGRVHQAANGGIVLSHVTGRDAGNYTVEVNIKGSPDTYKHTLVLQVNTGLPTNDGHLHVHQEPDAVLDNTTQRWSLVLACGHFNFLQQPPFLVEWLTPSSHILASTNYKDGYFYLHLANPIEDGSYTCRVPQQHVTSACLHGNATGQVSIAVDRMEARMTLMEAEVRSLRQDKLQLQQQNVVLQSNLTALQGNLAQQAADFDQRLREDTGSLNHSLHLDMNQFGNILTSIDNRMSLEIQLLKTNVTVELDAVKTTHNRDNATLSRMIHDVKTPLIGFNAQSTANQGLNPPTHVKFDHVLYNAGQGYDSTTGDFTAPLPGTYFLIFHTRAYSGTVDSYMKANGLEVCRFYTYVNYDHGSCHAVVHLNKGDKVWMEPDAYTRYYQDSTTSFAGFLFYADP